MYDLKYFHKKRRSVDDELMDHLPWALLVAPGVILNKDGSFQKTFEFRGHDLASSTKMETLIVASKVNNILKRLGDGWAFFSEACRRRSTDYPEKEYPDPLTQMMEYERKEYFKNSNQGWHFESRYYATIVYLPPTDKMDKLVEHFIETEQSVEKREHERVQEHLRNFLITFHRVYDLFNDVMYECHELTNDETLTYLHDCISIKRHPVKTPDVPVFLDRVVADSPFIGGTTMTLGQERDKHYLGVISIIAPPEKYFPGILDELNRLPIEYRWCTRYIALDKTDALEKLDVTRRNWFSSRKGFWAFIKEAIFRAESAIVEISAVERYNDTQAAITEVRDDVGSLGYYCNTFVVMENDEHSRDDAVREIERVLNGRGFTTKYEDYNAASAWMGTLPGLVRANIRWPFITSLELAYMFPLSAVWAGDAWNKHLNAPALMQTETSGSTPFRFNLHYNDFGNAMIIGPIGSGKSVLLNTIEMHCRGYKNAKIYIFDKGGSCRAPTAGVGGVFYDLGETENGIAFQPLRYIDREDERVWASEWLQMIYEQENIQLTPEDKSLIWAALQSLAESPAEQRTMSGFYMLVQSVKLKEAISPFVDTVEGVVDAGPYGALFGATEDKISDNPWQAFEMGILMEKKAAIMPVLQYLFHVIEKRCHGEPTFIFLDECWTFLGNPLFAAKIKEWFKTMRKNNVSIIFATQSLTDITESNIASAILESCYTRIFLPNPNALTPDAEAVYSKFSLNETERSIIATATPKRQYYFKSILGCRVFELALSSFLLSYVGAASKEDQAEIRRIQREHPDGDFNIYWLKYKGQEDALQFYLEKKKTAGA
jgi:type IV secretion/conjugal transfer VirB4 family ATPase